MIKICFGCGIKLQSEEPLNAGFVPLHKYEDSKYCQRCFKLTHYGVRSSSGAPKKNSEIIKAINRDHKYVLFLVDFLNLNAEVINLFKQIKQDKLLIITKADIIPQSVKETSIRKYIKDHYQINAVVKFFSSYHQDDVLSLTNYLARNEIKEAYILGLSNVGKSTLLNALIKLNKAKINKVTTSYTPNTTLDFVRVKISEDLMLVDAPGFMMPMIDNEIIIKKNNIKSSVKPKVYQMKKGETLKIEDMHFNFAESTSITLYMANDLAVTKYYQEINFTDELNIQANSDLLINGLGFMHIKKAGLVKMANINPEITEVRTSIFGAYNE